jgi:protoheme IX farnesyltransferase
MSMTTTTLTYNARRLPLRSRLADYFELTKPKIAALELVTVAVAAFVAGWVPSNPLVLVHALVGTALIAASASALNQWLERDTDALMERTAGRPLPAGRLSTWEVALFSTVSVIAGAVYLAVATNVLTAILGLATWVIYVWIYTPLKSRTTLNTPVGAVAGAIPILMGWTAGGAALDLRAAVLFSIVFLWQFPHFMAIAWIYRRQYAQAGLKMSPVVDPSGRSAGRQAVWLAALLVPVTLLPALTEPPVGIGYFLAASLFGLMQFYCAVSFSRRLDESSARRLMRVSIVYLPALLVVLLASPLV